MQGKLQIQLQFKKKIDISKFNVEVVINFFHFIIIGYKLVYSTFKVAIKIPKVTREENNVHTSVFVYLHFNKYNEYSSYKYTTARRKPSS